MNLKPHENLEIGTRVSLADFRLSRLDSRSNFKAVFSRITFIQQYEKDLKKVLRVKDFETALEILKNELDEAADFEKYFLHWAESERKTFAVCHTLINQLLSRNEKPEKEFDLDSYRAVASRIDRWIMSERMRVSIMIRWFQKVPSARLYKLSKSHAATILPLRSANNLSRGPARVYRIDQAGDLKNHETSVSGADVAYKPPARFYNISTRQGGDLFNYSKNMYHSKRIVFLERYEVLTQSLLSNIVLLETQFVSLEQRWINSVKSKTK